MKNDPIFKFVAAIIFAGVLITLFGPHHASAHPEASVTETPAAVNHTE